MGDGLELRGLLRYVFYLISLVFGIEGVKGHERVRLCV